jgi:hypothetical protein
MTFIGPFFDGVPFFEGEEWVDSDELHFRWAAFLPFKMARALSSLSCLCLASSALMADSSLGSLRGWTSPAPSARLPCRLVITIWGGSDFPIPGGRGGLGGRVYPWDRIEAYVFSDGVCITMVEAGLVACWGGEGSLLGPSTGYSLM